MGTDGREDFRRDETASQPKSASVLKHTPVVQQGACERALEHLRRTATGSSIAAACKDIGRPASTARGEVNRSSSDTRGRGSAAMNGRLDAGELVDLLRRHGVVFSSSDARLLIGSITGGRETASASDIVRAIGSKAGSVHSATGSISMPG